MVISDPKTVALVTNASEERWSYRWIGGGEAMEGHSFLIRLFRYFFWYPIINLVPPRWLRWIIKRTSRSGDFIIDQATTHIALEEMYGYSQFKIHSFWDRVWLLCDNCRAARNRLRAIKTILQAEICERPLDHELHVLSVGCGSARSTLEVATTLPPGRVKLTLLDQRDEAIECSKKLAERLLLPIEVESINWIQDSLLKISRHAGLDADIVELAGLLDYFEIPTCVKLLKQVGKTMKPGGLVIVTNGKVNAETPFVLRTAGWPLKYKTPADLQGILEDAGFIDVAVQVEPIGIQVIARGRKP